MEPFQPVQGNFSEWHYEIKLLYKPQICVGLQIGPYWARDPKRVLKSSDRIFFFPVCLSSVNAFSALLPFYFLNTFMNFFLSY